jgi:cholesterol oxidase
MLETELVMTADGAVIALSHTGRGSGRPVLLAPGFGMRAASLAPPTRRPNLVDALLAAGYDPWLLDYRTSPAVAPRRNRYTLDDIAAQDWPAAVAEVKRRTGADQVQVAPLCVGAVTFLMAVTAGHVAAADVRSAVCLQAGMAARGDAVNRLKSALHLPEVGWALGLRTVAPYAGLTVRNLALDVALSCNPARRGEHCHNPACRWAFGVFGPSWAHDQLDADTHDSLGEMFGPISTWAFRQLAQIMRAGHVVDGSGRDRYRPHLHRVSFPTMFLSGERGRMFLPRGAADTVAALRRANPDGDYSCVTVPGYAHLDIVVGRDAARDVYPHVVSFLDRTRAALPLS